ncbi:hypothetical protein R3Q06_31500 [Rhodococcus erythropolis]|uniref:hypothetical protein n=1 Tax=Rhodococcus erythropolis TaxID=1833 RepID=UPI00294995B5|nr:hypothetical protein [Rhodococcus erythropolis]MDV6278012.1 hypothetical protein [Rhodococcus erythropolis]
MRSRRPGDVVSFSFFPGQQNPGMYGIYTGNGKLVLTGDSFTDSSGAARVWSLDAALRCFESEVFSAWRYTARGKAPTPTVESTVLVNTPARPPPPVPNR